MAIINDQVLNEIALNMGRDEQIPGADLQDIMVPVVDVQGFRRVFRMLRKSIDVTALNTKAQLVLVPTPELAWLVTAGSFINTDSANVRVMATMTPDLNPPAVGMQMLDAEVMVGKHEAIIGPMSLTTQAPDSQRPFEIVVPNKSTLTINIEPGGGGTFGSTTTLFLRMLILEQPIERLLSALEADVVVV